MDSKKISVIIIIIGLSIGLIWIIFSNLHKVETEGIDTNVSIRNTINSLSNEEKQSLINLQNGDQNVEIPNAIKDMILPPQLEKGLDELYGK